MFMIDMEVERLRRLRGSALRVRAVARALGGNQHTLDEPLLSQGACAAWRIARAVSGHLRAHPYANFQKGASLAVLLGNSVVAKVTAIGASTRQRALQNFKAHLTSLARTLNDARALTRSADLSDSFGRCQQELRALIAAVDCETQGVRQPLVESARRSHESQRRFVPAASKAHAHAAPAEGDWPYLVF
jgi:hypothetical protein